MGRKRKAGELRALVLKEIKARACTASQICSSLGFHQTGFQHVLSALHAAGDIYVSAWDPATRGSPAAIWDAGDLPDAPKPKPKRVRPKKPGDVPSYIDDEDRPEDFPRTVSDMASGITRHYSGVLK